MLATQNEHLKVVEVLLDAKADPDITENVILKLSRYDISYYVSYVSIDCRMECSILCCQVRLCRDSPAIAQARG